MGFGGGSSSGSSSSESDSLSANIAQSYVDPGQRPFLQALYGASADVTDPRGAAKAGVEATAYSLPRIQQAFDSISALTDPTGQIAAQEAALSQGLGRFFREEINPEISRGALAAGQSGGARQGVAQGVAAGQLADAFTQGRGDIVARANQTALGASAVIPTMAQTLYDTSLAPSSAGLDPLAQLAEILGGPTVLQTAIGQSASRQRSRATEQSSRFSFGFDSLL